MPTYQIPSIAEAKCEIERNLRAGVRVVEVRGRVEEGQVFVVASLVNRYGESMKCSYYWFEKPSREPGSKAKLSRAVHVRTNDSTTWRDFGRLFKLTDKPQSRRCPLFARSA